VAAFRATLEGSSLRPAAWSTSRPENATSGPLIVRGVLARSWVSMLMVMNLLADSAEQLDGRAAARVGRRGRLGADEFDLSTADGRIRPPNAASAFACASL
jgi:hypothetical protein